MAGVLQGRMHPLEHADVLSRVLTLLGMEHWPAAAQVCHGWHSASVAKALEFRILQPEPLLTSARAAVVGIVALPDGTLCSSDTLCHQLLVTAVVTTAAVHDADAAPVAAAHAAAAHAASAGCGAASSAAVLPRRLGRQGHRPGELERPTGLVCDAQGERLFIVERDAGRVQSWRLGSGTPLAQSGRWLRRLTLALALTLTLILTAALASSPYPGPRQVAAQANPHPSPSPNLN